MKYNRIGDRASFVRFIYLKGEFTFFIRELDVPPLGESNLKKSVEVIFFHGSIFWGAPNVINNAGCTVLP